MPVVAASIEPVLLLNKITKIESNSQQIGGSNEWPDGCFYWTKLQKLKAIHNLHAHILPDKRGAFTEQNYKNWKQFTTNDTQTAYQIEVLLLNKITKIESNSQPRATTAIKAEGCFYWTKLQKLKAIHNATPMQ